jgi:BirA family biotin operon repressor/biotin-[acetyl-CoA-carboxylase] ligase
VVLACPPTLGRPRVHLRETGSTNDRARELADAGAPHGTLVTASSQSAGRGRQGRSWSAPANSSLLMSLLLRAGASPDGEPPAQPLGLLPLIAAVAVCDVAGEDALIKWPNDVVLARPGPDRPLAKLAGILTEGRPQAGWAVLGIGLNVAVRLDELPDELRAGAATLGYGRDAIEPTLERLLAALERRLAEPTARILDAWRSRDALYGREIAWGSDRGRAQGIDAAGHLLVALDGGGLLALDAGEVHLRPGG